MKKDEIQKRIIALDFWETLTEAQRAALLVAVHGDAKPRTPRTPEAIQRSYEVRNEKNKSRYTENRTVILEKASARYQKLDFKRKEEMEVSLKRLQSGVPFPEVCVEIGCTETQFRTRFRRFGFPGTAPKLSSHPIQPRPRRLSRTPNDRQQKILKTLAGKTAAATAILCGVSRAYVYLCKKEFIDD